MKKQMGHLASMPAYEITPLGVEMTMPMKCEGCTWRGKKGQASERNGCAACPRCSRFVYPDETRLEKS